MAIVLEIHLQTTPDGFKITTEEHKVTLRNGDYENDIGHIVVEKEDLLYCCTSGDIEDAEPCLRSFTYCLPKEKDEAITILKSEIIERFDELQSGLNYLKNCFN